MSIEKQKEIAEVILNVLEVIDPLCILAGGAPRDWFFNKEANDLDFYIHIRNDTMDMTALRFKNLGLELKPLNWDGAGLQYKCMEHLHRIYEGAYCGQKYQVMVMKEKTTTCVIDHFGTSVCKAWWKGGEVQTCAEFLVSHYTKTIFKKDDYTAKVLHVEKMMQRYPKYKVEDYSQFDLALDRLAMRLNVYPSTGGVERALKEKFDDKV